ncbi:hypothetical protein ACLBXM_02635 [Xanthobacteraceae bacterium A53D]
MATDIEKLVVQLSADVRGYQNALAKAQGATNRQARAIEARFQKMNGGITSSFASMGKGLAGVVGVAGIGGVIAGVKQAVTEIAELSAEAKRAGVGVEVFQELKYAALQSRIGVDALTDGLKELSIRGDEFATTGAGGGAEAFQRLGYSSDQLSEKLKNPAALLAEVIERVRELDKSSQIRVLDEIFGGQGGEQLIRFLDRGRNSVEMMRKEARETGAVLDEEMVKRAEEIDRRFQALATTIGTNVKGAVLGLIDAMRTMGAAAQDTLRHVADAPKVALDKTDQELAGMRAQLAQHQATRNYAVIGDLEKRIAEVEKRRAALAEAVRETTRAAAMTNRDGGAPPAGSVPLPLPRPEGIAGQGDTSNIKKAGETAKRGYEELHAAAMARLTDLEAEQVALGMTTQAAESYRFKQQALAEATRMQLALTPEQVRQLDALAAQYGQVSAAVEMTAETQARAIELQQELGATAADAFSGLIKGTDSWSDALSKAADRLSDLVLQAALMGSGPMAGLFGSAGVGGKPGGIIGGLFGLFDKGGYTGPGGVKQPAGLVHRGEVVFSQKDVRRHGGVGAVEAMRLGLRGYSDGGPVAMPTVPRIPTAAAVRGSSAPAVTFAPSTTIDARGSQMSEAQFKAVLDERDRRLMKQLPAVVEQKRGRVISGRRT